MTKGLKVERVAPQPSKIVATIQLQGRTDEEISADIDRLFAGDFEIEEASDDTGGDDA